MKEHIVSLCNQELARRTVPNEEGEESIDTPLVRGYNFLRGSLFVSNDGARADVNPRIQSD